jgi:hypothetical protein
MTTIFKFQVAQVVTAKSSGKSYKILALRADNHWKLKGEIGYTVVGQRNGKAFGPLRLMRESSFTE